MSDVQRLKEQLFQVSMEAKQAAGGLAGFKLRFIQHSQQVEGLIAGTATGVDRDIAEILAAAGKAVQQVTEALEIASAGASKDVTLYVNNRPCPRKMGCYAILEDLLPVGTKLTLYWPESGGLKSDVFRGNGKGVA